MWFKRLHVAIINFLSNILEDLTSYNLACKVYRIIFQFGVFPKPKNFKDIVRNLKVEENIEYKSSILENNNLDVYYPRGLKEKVPVLMWIHGGGYIANSKETVKNYMMTLANKGFVVFNINYALAPKYKYPSQIVQCNEALSYVFKESHKFMGDRERIFIGGDSAGAQMASQLGALISNEKLSKKMNIKPSIKNSFLKGVILFCGLYNMDSLRATKFPGTETYMEALTGKRDFEHYEKIEELSTIDHISPKYPSTFITVGDLDPFLSQGEELASSLNSLGVKVYPKFYKNRGLWHEYQFKFSLKEARETFKSLVNFLRERGKVLS